MIRLFIGLLLLSLMSLAAAGSEINQWFEQLKKSGDAKDIYKVLYAMPKGGDLHAHASGSVFSEWWYELALEQEKNGYIYYTKTKINNCKEYGGDEFRSRYLMYFLTIQASQWQQLDKCEQGEYRLLSELNELEKTAWMNSIRLDKPHEGRDEFFETHWQRLGALTSNPYLAAEALVKNMKAFSDEGLIYMEPDYSVIASIRPDGTRFSPEEGVKILQERLAQKDVKKTGMTIRFQLAILRFVPDAIEHLEYVYEVASRNPELWVGIDMVGREDDDKGYPGRFLNKFREMRRKYHGIHLSIHAGEVDEPNLHVRDTLLLGAERIGHGVNLITDPDLMILMRGGPYLVEINLVSNKLLKYVDDYSQHPFPEYLRLGIPVALSTDDRGMWDSTMTDEFFVGVHEFNLSWDELKTLSRNSLKFSFVDEETKNILLSKYEKRIASFEKQMLRGRLSKIDEKNLQCRGFISKQYDFCQRN
ncbi:MAG: hypothetical protein VB957_04140 [Pseudomonadales bacterium]